MNDLRDQIIQEHVPTVMAPRFNALPPLDKIGHRFIVAANGLWLEVNRHWLHVSLPVSPPASVTVPYGLIEKKIEIRCPAIPVAFLREFYAAAKSAFPNECAAWVTYNHVTGDFKLRHLEAISEGPGHIDVTRPKLSEGEELVLDLHSHGQHPAFFSSDDDRDDFGEVKLSGVLGNVHEENPTWKIRLCVLGHYEEVPHAFPIAKDESEYAYD